MMFRLASRMHEDDRIRARSCSSTDRSVCATLTGPFRGRGICNPQCRQRHGDVPGGEVVAARRAKGPANGQQNAHVLDHESVQ